MVGATEQMTFGSSEGSSGFVYVELDGPAVARCDFVPTPSQPRRECLVRTTELGDDPPAEILRRLEPFCTPETLVKLRIEGPISRENYHRLDVRRIYEFSTPALSNRKSSRSWKIWAQRSGGNPCSGCSTWRS